MILSLGFSPCPNDTFIFENFLFQSGLPGVTFEPKLLDVETLNKLALKKELDITKLSFAAWLKVSDSYQLLNSGAALGNACGPLLIANDSIMKASLRGANIAIPGELTTANFLLKYAVDFGFNPVYTRFDQVEDAVLDGTVDAGVIIHENRFTYQDRGLYLVEDLGQNWEMSTGMPIPLGGIAVKRDLAKDLKLKLSLALSQSVIQAQNKDEITDFIKKNAQEMDEEVMRAHINLYVNKFTVDIGNQGKQALNLMAQIAKDTKWIDKLPNNPFVK